MNRTYPMKTALIAALITLTISTLVMAQEPPAPAATPKKAATATKSVPNASKDPSSGRITFVSDKKINIKAKGAECSTFYMLAPETKITVNGEAKTVSEIKKGWKGTVTPKADNVATAAEIVVTTSKEKGSDPAKETEEEVVEVKLTPVKE
jgi:hypothetical protein